MKTNSLIRNSLMAFREAAYQEVVNAWEKVGVKVYAHSGRKNLYKVNGKFGDIWTARKLLEEKLK